MRLNLRKRLLLPTLALLIAAMGLATGLTFYLTKGALKTATTQELDQLARSKAELIDLYIEDLMALVRMTATDGMIREFLKSDTGEVWKSLNDELGDRVKAMTGLSHISVANPKGEVRASSLSDSVGKVTVQDRDYFQKALKGEVNVASVYTARATGKPAFSVAAPVKDGEKIVGVLFAVPDLGAFSDRFVAPVKVGRSGYLTVTEAASGIVFAHQDKSQIMKLNLKEHDFGKEMLRVKKGSLTYSFQGAEQLIVMEPSQKVGWTVGVIVPTAEIFAEANHITLINLGVTLVGLLAVIVVLVLVIRSVVRPINRIIAGLDAGSDQVAGSAAQMSAVAQQLAEGSSEQAASLEETSSAMEEMASMTKSTADNTAQANALMTEAQQTIGQAGAAMAEMGSSMAQISEAGGKISKIVKSIDEIAFQTNLLALNAAVEAARAGEAGAGFAVVADEVRNLALRAAEAAKNTQGLIEETITRIDQGSTLVSRTQAGFDQVLAVATKVAGLIAEVAAASGEQSQGIDQVVLALGQMDQVTQRTAASAEESSASAEEMNAQAESMKILVTELVKLVRGNGTGPARTAGPAGPPPGGRIVAPQEELPLDSPA